MSRHQAKRTWQGRRVVDELAARGILIRSVGMRGVAEEAPGAYKDIRKVMRYQDELVEVLGEFSPKIVRMCGDDSPAED